MKRREAIALTASGVLGAMTGSGAGAEESKIEKADIVAADKLAGRTPALPAEQELMRASLEETRTELQQIRAVPLTAWDAPSAHFQPRLPDHKPPTGKSGVRLSKGKTPSYDGNPESIAFLSVVELSRLVKARKVTSVALTRMYLERLKRHAPSLYCVVNLTEALALEQAARADAEIAAGKYRGALHGIPYGAKDLFATRGIPTTWGAKPYEKQVFDANATVIDRLEQAGAVLVAKLSVGELAMGDVWFGGKTRNPWNPEQGASGSSAGSGSAVAAGLVGFALGTETLGSIVSPSVRNSVTGLRPSFGRVSRHGAMPLAWTMDKVGPLCRTVEDCALVFHAIQGSDTHDPTTVNLPFTWNPEMPLTKLRVGVDRATFQGIRDTALRALYEEALQVIGKLGVVLRDVTLPKNTPAYQALPGTMIGVEAAASFTALTASEGIRQLVQQDKDSWPNTFRVGATIPASDYVNALRVRAQLQREMHTALKDVDVLLSVPLRGSLIYFTNLTGHPTLVTRCGMQKGQPVLLEFVGNMDREAEILRLAHAYERVTEWHHFKPSKFT
jgi:Asp-tRNA(Asn)/Glu-tRNA(Gln) amidotransferase A subunit family amidase